jgi:hypothetical protein
MTHSNHRTPRETRKGVKRYKYIPRREKRHHGHERSEKRHIRKSHNPGRENPGG